MSQTKNILRKLLPRTFRNWLRSPRLTAGWLADDVKHRMGSDVVLELRPGWSLRCHPAAARVAYLPEFRDPDQIAEFDGFQKACEPGMSLFDLGAHFGLFSLAALHYGGPEAWALAVDPSAAATRMIALQARINGLADRLKIVQAAVADTVDSIEMVQMGVLAGGYLVGPTADHPASERVTVPTVTIDSLAADHKRSPSHIKIDVESYEAAALRGGRETLTGPKPPRLFIELHHQMSGERGGDPAEALDVLQEFGYRVFSTLGDEPVGRDFLLSRPLVRVSARRES